MTNIAHGFAKGEAKPKVAKKTAPREIKPFKSDEGSRKTLSKAAKHKSGRK